MSSVVSEGISRESLVKNKWNIVPQCWSSIGEGSVPQLRPGQTHFKQQLVI